MLHRRRRTTALVVLLIAAGLVVADLNRNGPRADRSGPVAARTSGPTPAGGRPSPEPMGPPAPKRARGSGQREPAAAVPPVPFPVTGRGAFEYATGASPVRGAAGPLLRFLVAVESGTGQDPAAFASVVDEVVADRRGWTASRRLRLQRVPPGSTVRFTIFLATPGTSERMCADGGLRTERFTSCRLPGKVIINLARWWQAVPGYGAPLAEYRAYAVNHEVGHELGFGHEACPGAGRTAPVMQQQTLGLHGCVANGWPYLGGRRHAGARIP